MDHRFISNEVFSKWLTKKLSLDFCEAIGPAHLDQPCIRVDVPKISGAQQGVRLPLLSELKTLEEESIKTQ